MTIRARNYRIQTFLRVHMPDPLMRLFPQPEDCGSHEWYNHDDRRARCYHCLTEAPLFEALPNINDWRRERGLEPIAELARPLTR